MSVLYLNLSRVPSPDFGCDLPTIKAQVVVWEV
jgi:hypothetical protein